MSKWGGEPTQGLHADDPEIGESQSPADTDTEMVGEGEGQQRLFHLHLRGHICDNIPHSYRKGKTL